VTYPVQQILPISLYEVPDQYWTVLRNYKDDPWPEVREHTGTILAATVARFTARHWACISAMIGAEPSLVTTVPSTGARRGQHPLARAVRRSSHLLPLYTDVLRRGPGVVRHRYATDNAFLAAADRVRGHRVLLVEDTFTTGARTQSAASALRIAGASAVGVVAAGRVIDPSWNDNCQRVWQYARAEPFDFNVCCLCVR
jgi:hypothetical protein